jgi:hypothetical protein
VCSFVVRMLAFEVSLKLHSQFAIRNLKFFEIGNSNKLALYSVQGNLKGLDTNTHTLNLYFKGSKSSHAL